METKDMKTIGAGGLPTIGAPVSSGTGGDVVITPDVKYESYTAASGDTSITDILPEEGEEDVIYRVGNWDGTEVDATKMSEYAWDGSDYALLRVVDSIGEVFDISAYNASGGTLATYADLAAALGTSGANVPEGVRKGGMSVKYVQSSDNNYVQFRYMPSDAATVATFTDVANWQGVDETPTEGSKNLVKSSGVAESILLSTLTNEIKETYIYPNFDVGQGSQVGGPFNDWYGWAKSGGLEEAGWLKEIHIGTGSLVAYSNIPCRVSKFVYNGTTLTGLKTIREFTINIPIGNGVINVRDKNIWFEKDFCLEINFAAIGNISKSTNLDILYRTAASPYVRFNNQVLTSGSIWNIDVVVESIVSVKDKIEENSKQIEVLDNKKRFLFPNFTNVDLTALGAINAWWGYSTKDDLPSDGYISGVKVCEANVKTSQTTINFRISKKVRDSSGAITGCTTIKEFSAVLAAGETEVHFAPMRFLKDYVLETNIYDLGNIKENVNFTIRYKSSAADGIRYVKYVGQSVSNGSIWKIDAILTLDKELPPLNVLIIGNSYSEDAFTYVPQLIKNYVNLTLGILYYGGASLEQHNTFLTDEDAVYDYEKCVGDGQWVSQSSKSIQFALADVKWDVIILQQKGSAVVTGGIKNDLNTFISNLFNHLDHPVKLAWHFTLAWDTTLSTSITHYNDMVSVVQSEVIEGSCIRWIIPTATAIQNARTTSLQSYGSGGNLMYTDTHAQEGIPCYILACAAAESILTEMGIQASIFANNIRPVQAWITACNVPHQNGTSVGVSDANCRIAQMAALQAIKFPFVITDCSTL